MVNDKPAEELVENVFFDGNELISLRKNILLLLTQPHQLAKRRHRVDWRARALINLLAQLRRFQPDSIFTASKIGPRDHIGEWRAFVVNSNQTVHRCAERHTHQFTLYIAAQYLSHHFRYRSKQYFRIK